MRIILITGDDLEHRYVAHKLAKEVALVGIVVDRGQRHSVFEKCLTYLRRYTWSQLLSRSCLLVIRRMCCDHSRRKQTLVSMFGPEYCATFPQDLVHQVHGINTQDGMQVVSALQPDVILVFGTGIVKDRVLAMARMLALNLHSGISPYYRGTDCVFWAIYNQELQLLGATVHECTSDVDGGRIFGTTTIKLSEDDTMFSILGKCIIAGADLYGRIVKQFLESGLEGSLQDSSVGREYKAFMRGLGAEFKVRRSLSKGVVKRFVKTNQYRASASDPGNA
jgi:methionyl-tRNA formyltransferase